jgi:hypothetical protein
MLNKEVGQEINGKKKKLNIFALSLPECEAKL